MKKGIIWGDKFNDAFLNIPAYSAHYPNIIFCKMCLDYKINIKWLTIAHKNGYILTSNLLEEFIKFDNLECFKYVHKAGIALTPILTYICAYYNNLSILEYIHENGCVFHDLTCHIAAINNNLKCLQYARDHGCQWNENTICKDCVKNEYNNKNNNKNYNDNVNNLTLLEYCHKNGGLLDVSISYIAARFNDLSCLIYLKENNCPWDAFTAIDALNNDHIFSYNYMINNGCEILLETLKYTDNLEIVKELHKKGCILSSLSFDRAVDGKNIELIEYLIQNNCPFDGSITYTNSTIIKLLYNYNISWNTSIYEDAIIADDLDMIKYIYEHGCIIEDNTNLLHYAILHGNLEIIKYCHSIVNNDVEKIDISDDCWLYNTIDNVFTILKYVFEHNLIIIDLKSVNQILYEIYDLVVNKKTDNINFNNNNNYSLDDLYNFINYIFNTVEYSTIISTDINKLELYHMEEVNVFKYIIHNCKLNPNNIIITSDSLECIKYAYSKNCEINMKYSTNLANMKFLDSVCYNFKLHKNVINTNFYKNWDIVDYAYHKDYKWDTNDVRIHTYFINKRNKEILAFLSTLRYTNASSYMLNCVDKEAIKELIINKLHHFQ